VGAKRLARRQPVAVFCFFLLLVMTLVVIAAPLISPYTATEQSLRDSLLSPRSSHLLGTDQLGRDILARVIYGGRVSLTVGFGVMIIGGGLAALLGGFSGFIGGWVDSVIQRIVDAFLCVPGLLLLMTVLSAVDHTVLNITLTIGLFAVVGSSRTIRSTVIAIRARPYIESARAAGVGPLRLFFLHVMPNAAATVIVVSTLWFGSAILVEAGLEFLGYGIAPPTPTWGGMLAGDSRSYLISAPWLALAPGITVTVVLIAVNLLGDGLRDVLDPRLSRRD
jgi:peptide/nickel transport system permease protein